MISSFSVRCFVQIVCTIRRTVSVISHHGSCTVGNSFKRVTTIKDTHRTDGKTWSVPDTSDGICLDWFHYHEVGAQ